MKKYVILFHWCLTLLNWFVRSENCIDFPKYKLHLGTKTPYRFVGNMSNYKTEIEGCSPSKIWLLVRHGTRNPSASFIMKAKVKLSSLQNKILKNKLMLNKPRKCIENFVNWTYNSDILEEKKLRVEGEDEMILLAERMQNRFPGVLSKIYTNTSYFFKHTKTQRTKESALSFAKGLFGKYTAKDVWFPDAMEKDPILRFYKLCLKWQKDVKQNPLSLREREMFKKSHLRQLINRTNKLLGYSLFETTEDLHLIYTMCSFETAWYKKQESVWCSLLDEYSFKVLEYYEDLKYYWIDGYGHNINHRQACVAFQDVINFFKSPDQYPKAKIYVTHSGTLLKVISHLGLYRDPLPLTHDNFKIHSDRKWRVSRIDSFGTNLAFILYRCKKQLKVLTLHQENVVSFERCLDNLCDLNMLEDNFKDSINSKFDEICSL